MLSTTFLNTLTMCEGFKFKDLEVVLTERTV